MFLFSPLFGEDSHLDYFCFQWGWFKHQLDTHSNHSLNNVMHPSYGLYRGGQRSWKLCLCFGSTWTGWYFIVPGQSQKTSYKLWWLFGELSESYKLWVVYIIHVVVQCAFIAWLLVALHVVAQGFQQMDGKDWPPILLSLFCGILTCTCWTMAVRNSSTFYFDQDVCVCVCVPLWNSWYLSSVLRFKKSYCFAYCN